ncbi:PAS domain S-box protein [Mycolicibacterium peregrinum]|uniref:PAS domain-containing protein n=2 Tax=Mycolicibacterium peregrinum TaxID=43304 RepID=A0A4Z0HVG8_MYCPR|nr:PAS domain-containing protein [Mycolicibacterium peregrinum]TGB44215.1 PAS domain-containing protein [Mycolicibacterium peregrinum]
MERRQSGQDPQSPMALLQNLPALVVLERFPVPVLAIAEDGTILFANSAFGEMVGRDADAVKNMPFAEVFHSLPADGSAVSVMRANAGLLVELVHRDGSIVRARMSKSALLRGDDPVALATFEDLTEQLWADEL